MHARNDGTDTTKAYVPVSNNTKRECQIVWIFGAVSLAVIVEFLHILKISCIQKYFRRSSVGTLFALPWFLTWFGHSLNSYRNVVRLYDYFLASPFLMPLYVTAAIVLYREDDIFKEDCDMASLHCLLSQVRKSAYFPIYPLWKFFFSLFRSAPRRLTIRILTAKCGKIVRKASTGTDRIGRTTNDNKRVSKFSYWNQYVGLEQCVIIFDHFVAENNSARRKPKRRQNVGYNCNGERQLEIPLCIDFCHRCYGRSGRCLLRQHFQ